MDSSSQPQKLCPSCGTSVSAEANVCSTCGYDFNSGPFSRPPPPAQANPNWNPGYQSAAYPRGYGDQQTTGKEGLAIASLVLGIISLALFCVWYLAIPCAILAIIFGAISRNSANSKMALAGLVMGICSIVVVVLFVVVIVGMIMSAATSGPRPY
jgi:hypothetical protein